MVEACEEEISYSIKLELGTARMSHRSGKLFLESSN